MQLICLIHSVLRQHPLLSFLTCHHPSPSSGLFSLKGESGRPIIQPAVANGVAYNGFVRDNRCRAPPVVFADMGIRTRLIHSFETTAKPQGTQRIAFGMSTSVASSWPPPAVVPSIAQPDGLTAGGGGAAGGAMTSRPGTATSAWTSIYGSSRPGTAATTPGRPSATGGPRSPAGRRMLSRTGFESEPPQEENALALVAVEGQGRDGGATATFSGRPEGSFGGASDTETDGEGAGPRLYAVGAYRGGSEADGEGETPEKAQRMGSALSARRLRLRSASGTGAGTGGREELRGTAELALQQPWFGFTGTPQRKKRGDTPAAAAASPLDSARGRPSEAAPRTQLNSARRHGTADPTSPRRLSPTRGRAVGRNRSESGTAGIRAPPQSAAGGARDSASRPPVWLGSRALIQHLRPPAASSSVKWFTGEAAASAQDSQQLPPGSPPRSPGRLRPPLGVVPSPWARRVALSVHFCPCLYLCSADAALSLVL